MLEWMVKLSIIRVEVKKMRKGYQFKHEEQALVLGASGALA